jgi:hypothetical protein
MNTNDMDRYYWRTGHRWGGDRRPDTRRIRIAPRTVIFLAAVFAVTEIVLALVR